MFAKKNTKNCSTVYHFFANQKIRTRTVLARESQEVRNSYILNEMYLEITNSLLLLIMFVTKYTYLLQLFFNCFTGYNDVFVPLACERRLEFTELPCHSKVCGDKIEAWDCGDKVAEWLNTVLGYNGLRLLKHGTYSKSRLSKTGAQNSCHASNKNKI